MIIYREWTYTINYIYNHKAAAYHAAALFVKKESLKVENTRVKIMHQDYLFNDLSSR